MLRMVIAGGVAAFVGTVSLVTPAGIVSAGVQQATQASAADAAPFIGDWTLALQGPDGPGTFGLSVQVEQGKVVGEISNESMPLQAITDVSLVKKTLVLAYTFTYDGMPVDAVVSLTPAEDGTVKAQIDFAGGAYIMAGTATKKKETSR